MDPVDTASEPLHRAFERPALIVATVARMLLGLGLAAALILKVYMAIFTDHGCLPDTDTLGNAIRCTPTLEIVAQVLMLVAGFGAAALMFSDRPWRLAPPLLTGAVGVLLQVLAGIGAAVSLWQTALILAALMAVLAGTFVAMRLPRKAREPGPPPAP